MCVMTESKIGNRLRKLREVTGLSPEKLGLKAGISGQYIRRIEKGERQTLTLDTARRLADALGVAPEALMDPTTVIARRSFTDVFSDMEVISRQLQDVEFIPLIGSIPAGYPDLKEEEEATEYVPVPKDAIKNASKKLYALRIEGNSLKGDGIDDGDVIIVDRDAPLIEGKIYAFRMDNEVTVKHLVHHDGKVILRASNEAYDDIQVEQADVMGRVIASIKRF